MRSLIFVFFLLRSLKSLAAYQESPTGCLKKEIYPCAVWVHHKAHLPRAGMQIYASANSLFEIREAEVYLIRGNLWLVNAKPVTVSSRFGSAKTAHKNEIWAQASDEKLLVRALYKELQVSPRGASEAVFLDRGFEMHLSYVDPKQGIADYTWPQLASLPVHLKSFQTLVPSAEVLTEKAQAFGKIILTAVKVAADMDQRAVERKFASEIQLERRPKAERGPAGSRDSYLLELFRRKSDFAE